MTDLIESLAGQVKAAIAPFLTRGQPHALLDFPDYSNVGDSAIWLGEAKVLRDLSGDYPSYVCAQGCFEPEILDSAVPHGPIFLTGGGNFGDLYPRHQVFREMIIERYGPRVVQLPQSIHFNDAAWRKRFAGLVRDSGATLMLRDAASLKVARRFGCKTLLVPDVAFCLGPLIRTRPITQELLVLKRTDEESIVAGAFGEDWLVEPEDAVAAAWGVIKATGQPYMRWHLYETLAKIRLDRGVKQLSKARTVATDRLHAHILCTMLGIPHTVADNLTGKISAFVNQWTVSSPLVRLETELR